MRGYYSPEYARNRNMGAPECYEQVYRNFRFGTVLAESLRNRQRAVFIDPDALIRFKSKENFGLLPRAGETVRRINVGGFQR